MSGGRSGVVVLAGVVGCAVCSDSGGRCGGAADYFGNEAGGEGGEVGEDEVAHRVWGVLCCGEGLVEVVHGEGGEDRDNDVVVGEVGVDFLAEREVGWGGVVSAVDRAVGCCDVLVLKAGEEFLYVANALGAAGGVAKGVVVVVFHVESSFEALPFGLGEEGAEVGGVEVIGLVGAYRLHCVCLDMLALV